MGAEEHLPDAVESNEKMSLAAAAIQKYFKKHRRKRNGNRDTGQVEKQQCSQIDRLGDFEPSGDENQQKLANLVSRISSYPRSEALHALVEYGFSQADAIVKMSEIAEEARMKRTKI